MKQTEVETKLVEIKEKWAAKMQGLIGARNDVKEQRANVGREIAEKMKEHKRLLQQEVFYNSQIDLVAQKRREELSKFKSEHYSKERKLSEVSDYSLVNELVARGFTGTINNSEKPDDFMQGLSKKFSGGGTNCNIE